MRVIFVNRFFYPDISATSQMLTSLTSRLAEQCNIEVITSCGLYSDPAARLSSEEEFSGVKIRRLKTTRFGRHRVWRRLLDYMSFYIHIFGHLLFHTRKGDLVVLMTDPPLLSLFNTGAVRLRGGQLVNWLQDIFPEIAVELNPTPLTRMLSRPFIWWRNRTLKAAQVNVVISKSMQQLLAGEGVTNTEYIPNWSDGDFMQPLANTSNPIRQAWNPEQKFCVGYSGNFGRAHSFNEIITAIVLLQTHRAIHFVLVGGGSKLQELQQVLQHRQCQNISFQPYQAYESLPYSIGAMDLHLVSLKMGMEGKVMPSKICGVLAAGRPVAFIGDPRGEIARLIEENDCGFVVSINDGEMLAEKIRSLAEDQERLARYKINARALFEREFSLQQSLARWQKLLNCKTMTAAA